MENNIKTKFTVASEEGIELLQYLGEKSSQEKYEGLLNQEQLEDYLFEQYNRERIISDLNTFSNQLVIVYVDEQAAGFAYLTGTGDVPENLKEKRVLHLDRFAVLKDFEHVGAKELLIEKCMTICRPYDAVRMLEISKETEMISFYEKYGFANIGTEDKTIGTVSLPSVILIKENGV